MGHCRTSLQNSLICFSITLLITFSGCGSGQPPTSSPTIGSNNSYKTVFLENQKTGDATWQVTAANTRHTIEGYASATSVNRGESIKLFVNTTQPTYSIDIYRMRWYGGAGARHMTGPVVRKGTVQPIPPPDPVTGLVECAWSDPYILTIPNSADPTDWASGVYLAKLSAGGQESYIMFVVRDDRRRSDILMQLSVATYQAYNGWGGLSLYANTLCNAGTPNCMPRAYKVSFDRPNLRGFGTGDFLSVRLDVFPGGWEYNMLRFLEREGYDVTYTTDLDTHEHGADILNHKAFLAVGHDEYWSWQMRDSVEAARNNGVNLGFFSANTGYWQVRFEPDKAGSADRTIICYKNQRLDPVSSDPSKRYLTTTRFRDAPLNRPEDALVGVMYQSWNVNGDLVIDDASNWVWAGTGLKTGNHLPGLLGNEVDREFGDQPVGTVRLAHSPYAVTTSAGTQIQYADSTIYTANSGATVFAAGSMQWNWGLDAYAPNHAPLENRILQQATRNIFNHFGASPVTQ